MNGKLTSLNLANIKSYHTAAKLGKHCHLQTMVTSGSADVGDSLFK